MIPCIIVKGKQFQHQTVYTGAGSEIHCVFCQETWPDLKTFWEEVEQERVKNEPITERRGCPNCAKALALLNKYLTGRVYTDLDDALRQVLQAYITLRDLQKEEKRKFYSE